MLFSLMCGVTLANATVFQAIKMMQSQPRGGHIFNLDGAGSDGRPTPRCNSVDFWLYYFPIHRRTHTLPFVIIYRIFYRRDGLAMRLFGHAFSYFTLVVSSLL